MKSQMRIRTGLLSRVSTLALLAAAGGLGSVQQAQAATCTGQLDIDAPTTISTDVPCAVVDSTITGNVTNNANVGPGDGVAGFFIGKGGLITGELLNNDTIAGGTLGYGALTLGEGANVQGGIRNTSQISSSTGNGINLGYGTSDVHSSAALTGNITNSAGIHGAVDGIAAMYGTMSGNLTNDAGHDITGGDVAVYINDGFTSWTGGIFNSGNIAGDNAGIQVGGFFSGKNSVVFSGGIANYFGGTISGLNGPGIVAGGSSFSGGIYNAGVITQRNLAAAGGEGQYAGVGIVVTAETFNQGITNDYGGQINGLGGPAIWVTSETTDFNNGIINNGNISGVDAGILIESTNFDGGIINRGNITASKFLGDAIHANTNWTGDFDNQGLIQSTQGDGFDFEGASYTGNFSNSDTIFGGKSGVVFGNGNTDITGSDSNAQFTNTGSIGGTEYGVRILGDQVDMDFKNTFASVAFPPTPEISATTGAALVLAANNWNGSVTNDGVIQGGTVAMLVGGDFTDGFSLSSVDRITDTFSGTITNTGSIDGDVVGLYVTANTFNDGDIINTSTGSITGGETGALIDVGSFTGDIVNDGVITGAGLSTGLHVIAGTYNGDIVNNGELSAASNALHVELGALNGTITNTGLIESPGATAVRLEIDGPNTFVNTGGGTIIGDVVLGALGDSIFGGKATFIGEGGESGPSGIEGDIRGEPCGCSNDDTVIVRNGAHYFAGKGGTASNLMAFNVDDGGFAIMGAHYEGDPTGSGYAFSNVDALNVNNGGTLYIDKSTTLNVDNSYTQQAGGTLEFYLGAPGGEGFSSLTGIQEAVAGQDFGQIIVGGPVTLDGTIVGFLDPAFASANPGLEEVDYNDVIVADGGITGDFTTVALISNSSLFELDDIIDGDTVDLRLTRTSISDIGDIGGIIVNTGGTFDASVSDRSNGIGSGSCGMAGAGWCFNRFAANEPGATSVMNDSADDPFDWLRTGVRRVGETSVWGRAVGVWGNTDGGGGVPGSDFNTAGGIVGIDHVFTPLLMAGVAAQYTTADIDFDGRPDNANVDSFEAGAYMSYGDTRLYLNANASVIWHSIEVDRFAPGGQAFGDYDGTTISGYAEVGKIFETGEGLRIQPMVALSYSHLDTDAYSETGTANTLLNVFSSDFDSLKGMLGARFAYPIQMDSGRKMVPEARVMWAHEFMDDQSSFLATIQGPPNPPQPILGETFSRDTVVLGAGLTAPISASSTLFVDYDAGLNTDITTHTVSAGFRIVW